MENKEMEKELKELRKSNQWMRGILLSLIGLFFIGLCVGFGYTLGQSSNNNDEKENDVVENKKEEEKEDDKTSSIVIVSEKEKQEMLKVIDTVSDSSLAKYDNLDVGKLSNQEKLIFAASQLVGESENGDYIGIGSVTGSQITDVYRKYFGKNSNISLDTITNSSGISFNYDSSIDKYVVTGFYDWLPGVDWASSHSFIVSATKENDTYTLKVNTLFSAICGGGECHGVVAGSYADSSSMDSEKELCDGDWYNDNGDLDQTKIDADYEKVKDKMPVYTYQFRLEDGNYVLVSKSLN